jgi:hypothetical protein
MNIDRLIANLTTRMDVMRGAHARYELSAKTYPASHSTYSELAEWAKGKIEGYEAAIEMIREEQ